MNEENLPVIKLMIVDDHQMFIDGIKLVLRKVRNFKVIAEAKSGKEALEKLKNNEIDLVITDINMPEISGTELARIIKKEYNNTKILVVSSYREKEMIAEIIDSEAEGYILKNTGKSELISAINKIMAGGIFYCNEVIAIMMRNKQNEKNNYQKTQDLSPRELEVLKLICMENSTNEIATAMFISPLTVETYRKHLLRKTNSKSVVGLIKYAINNKLV